MITGMAACILSAAFPLIGEAAMPEKCRMLCYSGAVVTVDTAADTALSMVLGNIEAELGEEGLSAYLKAMETGDYTKFYMVQGSVTPTFLVEKYMTNAGGINLIDRRGVSCEAEQANAILYEKIDPDEIKRAKQNLRNLINDLKSTLQSIGMDDILIRKGSTLAIRPERIDCDYYRMLEGDMSAVNAFRGEYMEQYSWAEITKGNLHFGRI